MYVTTYNKHFGNPEITLCKQHGAISLKGVCMPSDAREFFHPILTWVQEYTKSPLPLTKVSFDLTYISSESLYFVYQIILTLDPIRESTTIHWVHNNQIPVEEVGVLLNELTQLNILIKDSLNESGTD